MVCKKWYGKFAWYFCRFGSGGLRLTKESDESLQLKIQASNNLRQQLIESGNFDSDTIEKIIDTFDKTADGYIFHKKQQ